LTGPRWRVVTGDIIRVPADAIVTAANSALAGGGGVDRAVHEAAGPELMAACRQLGGCPTGEARLTPGFRLSASWVIHAVGPVWAGGTHGEACLLAHAYRASLMLAESAGARALAFPAISAGAYGYPLQEALAVATASMVGAAPLLQAVHTITLVGYTEEVSRAWAAALGGYEGVFETTG
jgi:O-acetyl-ADP-ribose deacetylase (regulator of RNase III)